VRVHEIYVFGILEALETALTKILDLEALAAEGAEFLPDELAVRVFAKRLVRACRVVSSRRWISAMKSDDTVI
jgi:hypothetical protein